MTYFWCFFGKSSLYEKSLQYEKNISVCCLAFPYERLANFIPKFFFDLNPSTIKDSNKPTIFRELVNSLVLTFKILS